VRSQSGETKSKAASYSILVWIFSSSQYFATSGYITIATSTTTPHGPGVDPFPDLPVGAPSWNGRCQIIPKQSTATPEAATADWVDACKEGLSINVFCYGVVSNRNRADAKQIGATSAVLYHQGRELGHSEEAHGETVTEADATLRSLNVGIDTLTDALAQQPTLQHTQVFLFLPTVAALNKALDPSPHDGQAVSLYHINRIDMLMHVYPELRINLAWLPRNCPFVGFQRARQLALEAIRTADLEVIVEPQTVKSQKAKAEQQALQAWSERWLQAPRTSFAYQTALTRPPDGKPHPTFQASQERATQRNAGDATPPNRVAKTAKFSRATVCTLYRIITGHAFSGAYTQRFYPSHTPEQIACQCGEPIQTIEHVLMVCPLYNEARRKHLTVSGRPRNLTQLVQPPKMSSSVASFPRGDRSVRKAPGSMEPGMSCLKRHRGLLPRGYHLTVHHQTPFPPNAANSRNPANSITTQRLSIIRSYICVRLCTLLYARGIKIRIQKKKKKKKRVLRGYEEKSGPCCTVGPHSGTTWHQ
jgi:hypothetical protein